MIGFVEKTHSSGKYYRIIKFWLRGQDLNLRPSGYEPDELPGCSTPRQSLTVILRPGNDLLSRALRQSTIGAEGFHDRVRNGIGCSPLAITTGP